MPATTSRPITMVSLAEGKDLGTFAAMKLFGAFRNSEAAEQEYAMPPVVLSANDSEYTNNVTLSDAPAVWITGDRIRFINSESGRAITTTAGIPGDPHGRRRRNRDQPGGRDHPLRHCRRHSAGDPGLRRQPTASKMPARSPAWSHWAKGATPSSAAAARANSQTVVDLGGGDDFLLPAAGSRPFRKAPMSTAAPAWTATSMFENAGNVDGPSADNVEILDLRVNGYVESFPVSKRSSSTFPPPATNSARCVSSTRPTPMSRSWPTAGNTSLVGLRPLRDRQPDRSADFSDSLDLGNDTLVSGMIDLGAGDDHLTIRRSQFENPQQTSIGEEIDGGDGTDTLSVHLQGGDIFDAANVVNFESMRVSTLSGRRGTLFICAMSTVRSSWSSARHAGRSASKRPACRRGSIIVEPTASLTIAAGSIVGQVTSFVPFPIDTVISDDTKSISIVNQGQILGDVRMYIGDDLFDFARRNRQRPCPGLFRQRHDPDRCRRQLARWRRRGGRPLLGCRQRHAVRRKRQRLA